MNIYTNRNIRLRITSCNPAKWIKLGLLLIASCSILISCENDIAQIKKIESSENLPKITAEDYEVVSYDSTLIKTKLQTPEMIFHDNEKQPYTEFPKGVKLTQYDNKMKVVSSITAQYAKLFQADERWEAKNNVVAINQKGDTLKTEYLVWDKRKGKIYSNQFVKIIQKDQISTGTAFESNQDFSVISLKNLKGQMYVDVQDK